MNELKALIAGYGTLGPGVVRPLIELGFRHLVVTNRDQTKAAKSAVEIETLVGSRQVMVQGRPLDVSSHTSNATFASAMTAEFPDGIDLIVMAAGGNTPEATVNKLEAPRPEFPSIPIGLEERRAFIQARFGRWTETAMEGVYQANVVGPIACLRHLLPLLLSQERPPLVITIGSVSHHLSGVPHYASSKIALEQETIALGWELGWVRRQMGLPPGRAVMIRWGFTESQQSRALLFNADGSQTHRGQQILSSSPLGRFGTPAELGEAVRVVFQNRYLNSTFVVDGGFMNQPTV